MVAVVEIVGVEVAPRPGSGTVVRKESSLSGREVRMTQIDFLQGCLRQECRAFVNLGVGPPLDTAVPTPSPPAGRVQTFFCKTLCVVTLLPFARVMISIEERL